MNHAAATVCAVILSCAAGWHMYWGFGGRVGLSLALPQKPDGTPVMAFSSAAAALMGLILVAMALLPLVAVGTIPLGIPEWLTWISLAGQGLLLAARGLAWHRYVGLFKAVRDTPFGRLDTRLLSPSCLVAALCCLWVCLSA